jgi:hypothetical protein
MAEVFDWPVALRPKSVQWELVIPQRVGRSAFDASAQASIMGAPRWAATITVGVLRPDEVPEWEGLLDRLDGAGNRVRLWDWRREAPLGVATGAPVVRVAALGPSLEVEGWTANVLGILRTGSYFSVNGELKRLSLTADSDSLGRTTLQFRPALRFLPPVGAPLLLTKPTAKFRLLTPRIGFKQDGARFSGETFQFEEDPS